MSTQKKDSTHPLTRALWAVEEGRNLAGKRTEQESGLTPLQRNAVRAIGARPDSTPGEIAAALHVHSSTLSGVLGRLEALGAVERRTDIADGRRHLLRLTAKGRRLDEKEVPEDAAVRRALRGASPKDIEVTLAMLARIRQSFAPEAAT